MELSEARGKLIIIGGAEDKEGDCRILKEFVKMARGPKARIVVMTVATDHPEEVGAEYTNLFKHIGVDDVQVVDVSARRDTEDEVALKAIEKATGLFFTGGDQLHVTSLIGGTEMHKLIQRRYEKGVVIGGTSAGAAMMANSMIVGGEPDANPRTAHIEIGPGMDFLAGVVIDTHFSQRGRFGRLLAAVAHYPQDLGVGIDEDTALVCSQGGFEVIGEGAVTIIDAGQMSYTSLPYTHDEKSLSMFDVCVHVLAEGHKFDLSKRRPVEQSKPKKNRSSNSGKTKKQKG